MNFCLSEIGDLVKYTLPFYLDIKLFATNIQIKYLIEYLIKC